MRELAITVTVGPRVQLVGANDRRLALVIENCDASALHVEILAPEGVKAWRLLRDEILEMRAPDGPVWRGPVTAYRNGAVGDCAVVEESNA